MYGSTFGVLVNSISTICHVFMDSSLILLFLVKEINWKKNILNKLKKLCKYKFLIFY